MAHSSQDEDTSDTGCPPPCASTTSQTGRQGRLLWSELVPSGVQGVCWWGSGEREQEEGASCLSCHDSSMTELCYIKHVQRHAGKNTARETSLCGPFRHHFQLDVGDKYNRQCMDFSSRQNIHAYKDNDASVGTQYVPDPHKQCRTYQHPPRHNSGNRL